jgi:nitroreductase
MNTTELTNYQGNEILKKRKSIRAFNDTIPAMDSITSLFEAARWAPSSSNNQPWRYIYATKNDEIKFQKILDCLMEGNKIWASKAPLLIISLAQKLTNTGKEYRHHLYDTGAANMALALQATSLAMQAHTIGGFYIDKVLNTFQIDDALIPVVIMAVGYPGDINALPEQLRIKENVRERFELDHLILK